MPVPRATAPRYLPLTRIVDQASLNQLDFLSRQIREMAGPGISRVENLIVEILANYNREQSMRLSMGIAIRPQDVKRGVKEGAWQIPVRRITGEYAKGWKTRRIARGYWRTFNNAREAIFIEVGVNPLATGQVRPRPIGRFGMLLTIRWASRSSLSKRMTHEMLAPLRNRRGQFISTQALLKRAVAQTVTVRRV